MGYHRRVINVHELAMGVITGIAMIVLGILPGVFQAIAQAIFNSADRLMRRFPPASASPDQFRLPRWFAPLGAAVTAASFLAYFAK